MSEILEEQRESWGSRGAFIFAAIGSAVGLGNIWGFPYKVYSYGGAAFLIPYIIAVFCVGIPMMILEFSLGHFTQRASPDAFRLINKRFEFAGWWGIILGFVIITYYPVILAYGFSFLWFSLKAAILGTALPWAGQGVEGVTKANDFFTKTYLNHEEGFAFGGIQLHILITLAVSWLAMYFSIFRGVKFLGKVAWLTVPLPWMILLVLTVRGLTLPGSMSGLVYYLDPDWAELAKPTTWRFAFGHVFFSLSLAFGVMVTYAGFLHKRSDINNNAAIVAIADSATGFIVGLAIFSTLGGMAYVSRQAGGNVGVADIATEGPGLAFVALPYALAQLPGAAWWSLAFFFILCNLGVNSAFSITESVLASLVDKTGWKRCWILPVMSLVGFALGIVYLNRTGLNWLGTIDGFINGTWGIAFLGLLECMVLGWGYRIENLRKHANDRSDWRLGIWWNYSIRVVIPIILGTLFFWNLIEDFTARDGFLRNPAGQWILPNCVGIAIVSIAPVIAILLSLVKSKAKELEETYKPLDEAILQKRVAGRFGGLFSFALSAFASLIIILLFFESHNLKSVQDYFWGFAVGLAVAGLIFSNYAIHKHDKGEVGASWLVRWGGIIATLDISAFFALLLNRMSQNIAASSQRKAIADELSTFSYISLTIILLLIVGGLGWCFYRGISPAGSENNCKK